MTAPTGKTLFITDLTPGQQVREIFLVARKTLAETKAGKPYLALGLMDRTGEIEARVWDNARELDASAPEGGFVLVQGVAKAFREQLQLAVQSLSVVAADAVNLADFMPASPRPLGEMAAELATLIDSFTDPGLRALLGEIFQGETLTRFQRAPAAKKLHHAYVGGLIEHTLSMAGMAERTAAHYPLIDRDMLLAGVLLHDVAKIEEYAYDRPPIGYTDRGRLVGHLVLGAEMVRRAAERTGGMSAERVDQLTHLILSHHGQLAYGSPVLPMTPEAMLLHHLDDMDAKMQCMVELRRKMPGSGWQWSDYQRHLERFLYLPGNGGAEDAPEPFAEADDAGISPDPEPAPPRPAKKPADQRQQTLFRCP